MVRGDTCLWGNPRDFSDPAPGAPGAHLAPPRAAAAAAAAAAPGEGEAGANRLAALAGRALERQRSAVHPLLLAYHLDDAPLLAAVSVRPSRRAPRASCLHYS